MWKLHLYLKTELQSKGYEVGVTRTNGAVDLGLEERGMKAAGYDMFISLHSNASNTESVNRIVVPVSYTHLDVYKRQVWTGDDQPCR